MSYRGFFWTSNSPYIQSIWVRLRRAPRAAAISTTISDGFISTSTTAVGVMKNANPAYLIYECLTNTDWGMGGSPSSISASSFQYAASVYAAEKLGLFMFWDQQQLIEDFVGDVLDHVQSYLFLDPRTGLLTLKPLRADYVAANLPLFDPTNCTVTDFDRKQWGETVNEMVVTWTNPVTEQTETVTVQDLANIVQQGGQIVSDSRNYYGFRESSVALFACSRDLRAACAPLSTCAIKVNRIAWDLVPGDCLRLSWPEEDIEELVMRVQTVDYGIASDGYVTVTLIEDIFALDAPIYTGAPDTGWDDPAEDPNPISKVLLTTAPAFVVANTIFPTQPVEPEVNTMLLAEDPNDDFSSFEPYTSAVLANGSTTIASIGTRNPVPYGELPSAWVPEVSTTVTTFANPIGRLPQLADLVFIGDTEIGIIQTVNSDGSLVVYRGILDTVPQAHAAGAGCWFVSSDANVIDLALRSPGEVVSYRLLMQTSLGLLAYADAPDSTVTLTERPYLPLRPANVLVNGVGFGTVNLSGGDASVSWANRNRLTETSSVLAWTAGNTVPENAQTTTVDVLKSDGTVLHSFTGLSGTTYLVTHANLVGASAIRVSSARDGLTSLQAYSISVNP